MSDVIIRPCVEDDIEALAEISRITYNEHATRNKNDFPHDQENTSAAYLWASVTEAAGDANSQALYTTLAAEVSSKIVGFVCFSIYPAAFGKERQLLIAYITDISIHPDHRGKGIGKKLMAEMKSFCEGLGVTNISAFIWQGNTASEALFKAAGFDEKGKSVDLRLAEPKPGAYVPPEPHGLRKTWDIIVQEIVTITIAALLIAFAINAFWTR